MSNDFDFNIFNYTIEELEKFIGLKNDYTYEDVIKNHENLIKIVRVNNDYDQRKKQQLVDFANAVKNKIVDKIKNFTEQNEGFIENYDKLLVPSTEKDIVNQTSTTYAGHTFVMNKETTSFNDAINKSEYLNPVESYPTNVSRSLLNNLKRKTITQTVILNSLYREDYINSPSTDFNLVLPYYFKNVLSLRLSSIQLPNVIYCISAQKKSNTFFIHEDVTLIEGYVVMPDGNYNIADFTTLLETEINSQLGTANRFVVGYDVATQKITISNTTNTFRMVFLEYFYLDTQEGDDDKIKEEKKQMSELYKRIGWIMGFRNFKYKNQNVYTTEGIYNGASTEYFYFVLNDFNKSQSQNILGMFSNSIIGDNILGMIPLTSNSFSVCFDNGSDFVEKKREYFGPVNIQRLKIQLLDQYGEVLFLNNMDFSFSLELEIGYDW